MAQAFLKLSDAVEVIAKGGIGIIPTDTLYGVVCDAFNKEAVERVYKLKSRTERKPCIVLISDVSDLARFSITHDEKMMQEVGRLWPGAVSMILPCSDEKFTFLHRGTNSLAFRLPNNDALRDFLRKTGPLIAPSANPEGESPARSITEAQKYFGDLVDFYVDGGELSGSPSTLIAYENGALKVLREGAVRV